MYYAKELGSNKLYLANSETRTAHPGRISQRLAGLQHRQDRPLEGLHAGGPACHAEIDDADTVLDVLGTCFQGRDRSWRGSRALTLFDEDGAVLYDETA